VQQQAGDRFINKLMGHYAAMDAAGNQYVANIQYNMYSTSSTFQATFRDALVSKGSAPNELFLLTVGIDSSGNFSLSAGSDCRG
jgi:hypothetical protein